MTSIDFPTFKRVLTRSRKLGLASDVNALVASAYQTVLSTPLEAYLAADAAVTTALTSSKKETREAFAALHSLEQPYDSARAMVIAMLPDVHVPLTLASISTDTDKQLAVEALLHILDDHHAEPWAAAIEAGEFGQKAPSVLAEIDQKVTADQALQKAQTQRSSSFGAAYDAYIRFKRVVRSAYGSKAIEYHRIHVTKAGKLAATEDDAADPTAPAATTAPAPAAPAPPKPVPA